MHIPNRDEFQRIIDKAKIAGYEAALVKRNELKKYAPAGSQVLDYCGSAQIILYADGRSKFGKLLSSIMSGPIPNLNIMKDPNRSGYYINIIGMVPFQEHSVQLAAETAALKVIQAHIQVEGHVRGYMT